MANAAEAQNWINFAGAILLALTLGATAWAAFAAHIAAKAAEGAVTNDRAWMTPVYSPRFNTTTPRDRALGWMFSFSWLNSGATPAVACIMFCGTKVFPKGDAITAEHFRIPIPNNPEAATIGPNLPVGGQPVYLSNEDVERLQKNEIIAVVYTMAEYKDVYRPDLSHVSEAFITIEVNGVERHPTGTFPHFEFGAYGGLPTRIT